MMRNPLRTRLLATTLVLTTGLVVGDGLTAPADAHYRPRPPVAVQRRPAVHKPRSVRRAPAPRPLPAGDVWSRLRWCESSNRYSINTGNGYYGAYQFKLSTWRSLGYQGFPHHASPAVQDEAAMRLQVRSGWGQWPACSRRIGVR